MRLISTIKEVFQFLAARKKWWLYPLALLLVILGLLFVFASGSVIAPFIYTLF